MFSVNSAFDFDEHVLCTLSAAKASWTKELAKRYCKLRSCPTSPIDDDLLEGLGFDVSEVQRLALSSSIPARSAGNPLCIVRSDFGEIIAVTICETLYSTKFGWIGIRDRATRQQPGPGIDAVGVEGDETSLRLILLEVKVTTESRPNRAPQVVDAKKDSLWKQHLSHVQQREIATFSKVMRAATAARDKRTASLLYLAALNIAGTPSHTPVPVEIVCASALVRPQSAFRETDFGKFRSEAVKLSPAKIRFLAPLVADNLEQNVDDWYALVLAEAEGNG